MASAWGSSFAGAWGGAWGRRKAAEPAAPAALSYAAGAGQASDEDLRQQVLAKWEVIERAQRDDQALADQLQATRVQPVSSGQQAPDASPPLVPLSLDAQPPRLAPGPGVDVAGAALMPGALDGLAQDEEALLLLLLADL